MIRNSWYEWGQQVTDGWKQDEDRNNKITKLDFIKDEAFCYSQSQFCYSLNYTTNHGPPCRSD